MAKKAGFELKLYIFGVLAGAACLSVVACLAFLKIDLWSLWPGCAFRRATGLYCPGCGGTRALAAFLKGDWLSSFLYHPFVPYCGVLYLIFMARGTAALASKERFHFMKFGPEYAYVGTALILLQFAVKNVLLVVFGVDVFSMV